MIEVLINVAPGETRLALVEDGRLAEVVGRRDGAVSRVGAVYLGRVAQMAQPLDAAFVDIGLDRPGLLARADAPAPLAEGDAVRVEVVRDPAGDKGAKLTAKLSRAVAAPADATPPALIAPAPDPIDSFLAARAAPDWRIVVDDPVTAEALRRAHPARAIEVHAGRRPLFETHAVEDQLDAALDPQVPLADGASLIVEETAALVAIDVNAGPRGAARAVNLAAADEAARQLRLRNLAGQILIDFLPLRRRAQRDELIAALHAAVARDPREVHVLGLTRLGLAELTRRRIGESLAARLAAPGKPRRSAETAALDLLRTVDEQARYAGTRRFVVAVSPAIAALLDGPHAARLAALARRHALTLERTVDPALGPDMFRL